MLPVESTKQMYISYRCIQNQSFYGFLKIIEEDLGNGSRINAFVQICVTFQFPAAVCQELVQEIVEERPKRLVYDMRKTNLRNSKRLYSDEIKIVIYENIKMK